MPYCQIYSIQNMEESQIEELQEKIDDKAAFIDPLLDETGKIIVGQRKMMQRLLVALLSGGHILLEGLPGLAKTLAIRTLSSTVNASYKRIQFTPDLLPADILGTMIYNQATSDFIVRKGPIFAQFILADEINRAPAKVQSALLEAMQERQVTIGKESYPLKEPFLVLATQNPIEQEGTYPLPEAQLDRFMLKVNIGYPSIEEERIIIRRNLNETILNTPDVITQPENIIEARKYVREVYMDEKIEQYILDLVFATRKPETYNIENLGPLISHGGSPRASINLALAAKAIAFIRKRAYVTPDDVREICLDVMRHRIGLTYEAEAENVSSEDILNKIMQRIEVP